MTYKAKVELRIFRLLGVLYRTMVTEGTLAPSPEPVPFPFTPALYLT